MYLCYTPHGFFTCKILRHGADGFTSPPKEVVLRKIHRPRPGLKYGTLSFFMLWQLGVVLPAKHVPAVCKYSGVCYNERCYQRTMLQRTVFNNKIRMLQRTQMLQRTRRTLKRCSFAGINCPNL
jgi:hypothetical protein